MVMVVFEVSGNWRICSLNAAMPPMSRMSRLTTLASTGRRMKGSVKAFIGASSRAGGHGGRRQRRVLVDGDRRVGLQLDLAGGHDAFAGLYPLLDCDALTANGADAHESPLGDQAARPALARSRLARHGRRAGRLRRRFHDKHVVAV